VDHLRLRRRHLDSSWEASIAIDAAGLEAVHGDSDQALDLFDGGWQGDESI
jgi:hypothetical protein